MLAWCRLTAVLSFASSRNSSSFLPWAASSTKVLLWLVSEIWHSKNGLGTHQRRSDRLLPGLVCLSTWHLWVAARAAADQEFGEKGDERGHRCMTCAQADGTWMDQDPPHLALLPHRPWGLTLCSTAAPALVLSSVERMVHSETTQHWSFFSPDTMLERKSSGRGCII